MDSIHLQVHLTSQATPLLAHALTLDAHRETCQTACGSLEDSMLLSSTFQSFATC